MKRLIVAAFVAAAFLWSAQPAPADENGGLRGYVVDEATGLRMPGTDVWVARMGGGYAKLRTDRNGFFVDIALEPGSYGVWVENAVRGHSYGCLTKLVRGGQMTSVVLLVRSGMVRDCGPPVASLVDPDQTADVYRI